MTTEASLIRAILDRQDLTTFVEVGIQRKFFLTVPGQEAWDFIVEHHQKFGKTPAEERFYQNFPHFPQSKPPGDSPQEFLDDLKGHYLDQNLKRALAEVAREMSGLKPAAAFDLLRSKVLALEDEHRPSKDVEFTGQEFVDAFCADLDKRRACDGLIGMPWPWETANKKTQGIQNDDLVVIAARTGVGKTWILLHSALTAWKAGNDVIFVSNELTAQTLAYRQVAMLAEIPYSALRSGKVDTEEVRYKLDRALKNKDLPQFLVTGNDDGMTVGGVSFVESKIKRNRGERPLMVCIDGGYLLEDDLNGKDEFTRAGNIIRALKSLQKRLGVPFLVSWQLNRQTATNPHEASTKNLGLSDKVGQDSSYVVVLGQTEDDVLNKQMTVVFVKTRECGKFNIVTEFDPECQRFDEFNTESFESDAAVSEPSEDKPEDSQQQQIPIPEDWSDI